MVISAAARAAAKLLAKATTTKARKVKRTVGAKVRKHVGSIERPKSEIHHEKVLEKESASKDAYMRKKAEHSDTEAQWENYRKINHPLLSGRQYDGLPFREDRAISKHPIVSSFITVRGPAKAKPKGKVKLTIEKHSERQKTMQAFPKDVASQGRKSPIEFSTPLYGKFKPGEEILGTNVKTRLAITPKHELKYESSELKILFPEEISIIPSSPHHLMRMKLGMKPEKHVIPAEIGDYVFGKKRAISYSKKRVSTKGDTETTKKKRYELEVYTTFSTDEPIQIINKEPLYGEDSDALFGFFLAYPRSGKWFGRKRVGVSLTGRAQTKVTKGGKTVYQTQDHVAIDDAYFGVSFKPRDSVADKRLKGAGVFNNPLAEPPARGSGVRPGKPRKLPEVVLEPWEQTMKPKVVKLPLPTRFEVAAGVTVATGVGFATLAGIPRHKKPVSKKKKGGKR